MPESLMDRLRTKMIEELELYKESLTDIWNLSEEAFKDRPLWEKVVTLPLRFGLESAKATVGALERSMYTGEIAPEDALMLAGVGIGGGASGGLPAGAVGAGMSRKFILKEASKQRMIGNELYSRKLFRLANEIPERLMHYADSIDAVEQLGAFGEGRSQPILFKVAPPMKDPRRYYRPALLTEEGKVLWHPEAQIHQEVLDKLKYSSKSSKISASGGIDPEGHFWRFDFVGDVEKKFLAKGVKSLYER